jgi:dsRNA-specific ribonuclease
MLSQGQKHSFIQNALIVAINDPSFNFTLPELGVSTWDDLLTRSDERERLEFVGDALMHACVALELYKVFPDATPGLYTVSFCRSSLPTMEDYSPFRVCRLCEPP